MKVIKRAAIFFLMAAIAIIPACKKDKNVDRELKVDPHGKIAITNRTYGKTGTNEDLYLFDIRNKNAPKKMIFEIVNGKFKLNKTAALGANAEFDIDKKWPTNWQNIALVPEFNDQIINMDQPTEMYSIHYSTLRKYSESDFGSFPGIWKNPGKITGGVSLYEAYNSSTVGNNAIYFDLRTQEYLYYTESSAITGFKITDLIKKPNGNMDADPIDWTKADIVFSLDTKYNNKAVVQLIFVDFDTNTYASFVRNKADDPINGANTGRQTLLTTKWEPINQLFDTWPLN